MKNVSAILLSDTHIRETIPECRTDDFMRAQKKKWMFVKELQKKYQCPVLHGGDVFDHWKPNPFLIGLAGRFLPDNLIAIPGQHDLPSHSLEDVERSGINALHDTGKITLLKHTDDFDLDHILYQAFPWGIPLKGTERGFGERRAVALIHYGVYRRQPHYPGAEKKGDMARMVLRKMPGFDLIVSGDNHQTFVERQGDRLLVNPGSFMRTTAAQADHKPCVFLWDADTNDVEQVFLPCKEGVVTREHIEVVKAKDERLDAFVTKLDGKVEIGISFKENMKAYIAANSESIPTSTEKVIWEVLP